MIKTDCQPIQAYSNANDDDYNYPRTVPYTKIKYDLSISKPISQNYSKFSNASQDSSSGDKFDKVVS